MFTLVSASFSCEVISNTTSSDDSNSTQSNDESIPTEVADDPTGDNSGTPITTATLKYYSEELADLEAIAAKENKLILLFFSADWCRPCKEYKEVTFEEANNKAYLMDHFLLKYLDVETDFEGIELNTTYEVKSLPTLVFINGKGQEVNRIVGHLSGYSFLKKLQEIKSDN